jgi:hypothetical protein
VLSTPVFDTITKPAAAGVLVTLKAIGVVPVDELVKVADLTFPKVAPIEYVADPPEPVCVTPVLALITRAGLVAIVTDLVVDEPFESVTVIVIFPDFELLARKESNPVEDPIVVVVDEIDVVDHVYGAVPPTAVYVVV